MLSRFLEFSKVLQVINEVKKKYRIDKAKVFSFIWRILANMIYDPHDIEELQRKTQFDSSCGIKIGMF